MSNNRDWISDFFQHYGIQKELARNATTVSLFRLSTTCHLLYAQFWANDVIRRKFLATTRCDGVGMRIRSIFHQRPPAGHRLGPFVNVAKCGADDPRAREQECDSCGVMTCDECRIQVFYQDTHGQDHSQPSDLWGSAFLDPQLRTCWPAVGYRRGDFWDRSKTHNDLGYGEPHATEVDMTMVQAEKLRASFRPDANNEFWTLDDHVSPHADIDTIMECDLGRQMPISTCEAVDPDDIIKTIVYEPFNEVSETRKRHICGDCGTERDVENKRCRCTFKERFFDRWVCLRCHLNDWIDDNDYLIRARIGHCSRLLGAITVVYVYAVGDWLRTGHLYVAAGAME